MTRIYEEFKRLLDENGLHMLEEDRGDVWVQKGRIAISTYHMVDFAVMISKEIPATFQVVFNNVAYCKNYNDLPKYLEHINKFNAQNGVYYYLALDEDGRIFARHIHTVNNDVEQCVQLFLSGVSFVKEATSSFNAAFGEFVNV